MRRFEMDRSEFYVVDDDASVRRAIRRLLHSFHRPVRLFASAEEFLAGTTEGAQGCLILDLRLPGMTGIQLQRVLQEKGWKLPVIIVSAQDDDESREETQKLGAIAYLRKPFDRQQFLCSIQKALAANGVEC
jgi:FixJ family two-component response regulator